MINEPNVNQAFYTDAVLIVQAEAEEQAYELIAAQAPGWVVDELKRLKPKIIEASQPSLILPMCAVIKKGMAAALPFWLLRTHRLSRKFQMQGATRTVAEAYWRCVGAEARRSNAADGALSTTYLYSFAVSSWARTRKAPSANACSSFSPGIMVTGAI